MASNLQKFVCPELLPVGTMVQIHDRKKTPEVRLWKPSWSVQGVSEFEASAGSKTFSIARDESGFLYEIGYAQGTLGSTDPSGNTFCFPSSALYISKSVWDATQRKFSFFSVFPDLVVSENVGYYDVAATGSKVYALGPFLGNRVSTTDPLRFGLMLLQLDMQGTLQRMVQILGLDAFFYLGLCPSLRSSSDRVALFGNASAPISIPTLRNKSKDGGPFTYTPIGKRAGLVASFGPQEWNWVQILDATGFVALTSLTCLENAVIVAGSFSGVLQCGTKILSRETGVPSRLLVALHPITGKVKWIRVGRKRASESTYLSLASWKDTVFAAGTVCKDDTVFLLIEHLRGKKETLAHKEWELPSEDPLIRMAVGRKNVFLLSPARRSWKRSEDAILYLSALTHDLEWKWFEPVQGVVGTNYTRPLVPFRDHLFFGLGAVSSFSLGRFVLDRMSRVEAALVLRLSSLLPSHVGVITKKSSSKKEVLVRGF